MGVVVREVTKTIPKLLVWQNMEVVAVEMGQVTITMKLKMWELVPYMVGEEVEVVALMVLPLE